jgi:uncharacterized membrane protein
VTSTRSAIEITEWEGLEQKKRRWNSRDLALAAMLAALYAADVVLFAPISFQAIQVRVADALLPLSVLLGPAAVAGLGLGAFVGNFYASPFGWVDVIGGTVANVVATALAWFIGRRSFTGAWVMATSIEVVVITLIVGTYLAPLTHTPLVFSLLYVLVGEVAAVGIGGYILLRAVSRVLRTPQQT